MRQIGIGNLNRNHAVFQIQSSGRIDTADFQSDLSFSSGMRYVLVNGEFVVWDGDIVQGARPGRAVLGSGVVF